MKREIKYQVLLSGALALFGFTVASAQSTQGGSEKPMQSKQAYYQQRQAAGQQAQPVPVGNRKPVTAVQNSGVEPVRTQPAPANSKQSSHPVRIEQLRYQRNQAAAKGQSTAEYDKAIQEYNTNLAK